LEVSSPGTNNGTVDGANVSGGDAEEGNAEADSFDFGNPLLIIALAVAGMIGCTVFAWLAYATKKRQNIRKVYDVPE
jgi:hypothetical protein